MFPRMHSMDNKEITPEQKHIAATAIVVSKMLKLERRNFELYQQPLRMLVNVPALGTSDFQVPVRFMELLDPKRTMMAIEKMNFKCISPVSVLFQPLGAQGNYSIFGNLYIDCESVPSGTAYNTETIQYSKNIDSFPVNLLNEPYYSSDHGILFPPGSGVAPLPPTLVGNYETKIKSNDIGFRLSDVNFLNNSNIRFLLRIGMLQTDYPGAGVLSGYKTYPLPDLGVATDPPSLGGDPPPPSRVPIDTQNGFMTFQVVFYRYSGNDMANEE